jgi:hypothetical protein
MPHICADEVFAFLAALPAVGYCMRCIKLKLTRWTTKKVA